MPIDFVLAGRSQHALTYKVVATDAPVTGDLSRISAQSQAMAGPLKAALSNSYTSQNWISLRQGDYTTVPPQQPIVSCYIASEDIATSVAAEFLNDGGGNNVIRVKVAADANVLLELRFNHSSDR